MTCLRSQGIEREKQGLACNLGQVVLLLLQGKKIAGKHPALDILGDEGSGAYQEKSYSIFHVQTFEEELRYKFEKKYNVSAVEILENVYRKPLANRYSPRFRFYTKIRAL
jgi:hypothetical protein